MYRSGRRRDGMAEKHTTSVNNVKRFNLLYSQYTILYKIV